MMTLWTCKECGYIFNNSKMDKCMICGADKNEY